tara:strand:- start:2540 stop:2692 length:153 start_codon:yes stop_codon:yes gene_type:complete
MKAIEMERPKQTNCQNEPPYPLHETVLFTIRDPEVYMDKDCNIKKFSDLE